MPSTTKATVTLPSDTEILIERTFAAPRALVYRALTEPDLVRQWWCGERGEVTVCEIDLRVGGAWRYVMVAHGGFEVGFHGEFRELVPDERIVQTETFEGMPDGSALNTTTLTADGDATRVSVLVQHEITSHRDAHIDSGMESGMQEAYARLERVAQALRSASGDRSPIDA